MTALPETDVILACARRRADSSQETTRRLLRAGLDWAFLLKEAQRHAVLPLLGRELESVYREDTPAEVLDVLRAACRKAQQRNVTLIGELLRVSRQLERFAIEALPFKGAVLAAQAYGNASLRTFADLDLLIHDRDVARARDALVADGYVPEHVFTPRTERAYRKAECALQLRHAGRGSVVELHWRLTERYLSIDLPLSEFWERRSPVELAGKRFCSFAAEDLVLYLCVHGSKHRWERLEWLCSVASLIESRPQMDWIAIRERARVSGIVRIVSVALLLSNRLLDLRIPEPFERDTACDGTARALAEDFERNLFRPCAAVASRAEWYFSLLRSRERRRDRARIVAFSGMRLPHPNAAELVILPGSLAFLYYVFRPARLLAASAGAACSYLVRRYKDEKTPCTG